MNRIPSAKFLCFLFLFSAIAVFSCNNICGASLLEEAKSYRVKAERLQSEGQLDQAITYYQKVIGIKRHCLSAYNNLGICYERKGLLLRAEEWYLKALEVNPRYAPAHYNLGLLYERCGRINKAVFHWKQRLRLGHSADPAAIKARAKLNRYAPDELKQEDARELEQRILQQKAKDALNKIRGKNKYQTREEKLKDYYLQGMQFYQKGDYRQAEESFQRMIEALPVSNY